MKRIILILFAIGMTAMSSTSMAAMSNSRIRKETRFLTDKMAYELNLSPGQYNDAYEINYDFINSVRYVMDDVVRGYEWALDDYYQSLDVRNDDLRWVMSDVQYRRFLRADYFYRPIYANGGGWNFRVYITYSNHNHFYFGRPSHYRSYCGGHYRKHYNTPSYYRGRHNHPAYTGSHSVREERVYRTNRRSDFGSVTIRPNTSTRPSHSSSSISSGRRESTSGRRESTTSSQRKPESSRRSSSNSRSSNSSNNSNSESHRRSESRRETTTPRTDKSASSSSRRSSTTTPSSTRSSERGNNSSRR